MAVGRLRQQLAASDPFSCLGGTNVTSQLRACSVCAPNLYAGSGIEPELRLPNVAEHASLLLLFDLLHRTAYLRMQMERSETDDAISRVDHAAAQRAVEQLTASQLGVAVGPLLDDLLAAIGTAHRLRTDQVSMTTKQRQGAQQLLQEIKAHARDSCVLHREGLMSSNLQASAIALIDLAIQHLPVLEQRLRSDGLVSAEPRVLDAHANAFVSSRRAEVRQARLRSLSEQAQASLIWMIVFGGLFYYVIR
jgi:hypothetical protein